MPPTIQTFRATPTVRLNGEGNERLTSLVVAMVMSEQAGGLSSLELRVTNSAPLNSGSAEYAFDAGGELELGAEIIVGAGDASAPVEIFRGYVTGLEGLFDHDGPPELIILAEDALQKLRFARRTKVYENKSMADIVRDIANEHGLTPQVTQLDQQFGTQVQMNETDLGFLRRLLARVDADVQVVGTELQASPRSQVRRGEIELALGEELKSVRVLADLAHQITQATIKGWDVANGSAVEADGAEDALGPGQGKKGGEVVSEKFSERKQHSAQFNSFNQSEADALAASVRNGRARRFLRAQGVANGNPALRVGTHVRLRGVSSWFANTFYVIAAKHLFDLREGYRTEFEAECAFLGEAS